MRRFAAAVRKEFLQFLRDRTLVALVVFVYTADLVVCTFALSFDVRHLTLAFVDQDRTPASARLLERFGATDYFGRMVEVGRLAELDRWLDEGRADVALVIPGDFGRRVGGGNPAELQVLLSGANSNTANAARGYVNTIVERFAHDLLAQAAAARGVAIALPEIQPQIRIWYNPELEFKHFMAVSMIVVASLMVGLITTAASLVRERESGTIEQLAVTPLTTVQIAVAKAVPPFAVSMVALAPAMLIAAAFGIPFNGSVPLFLAASLLALGASMAIGVIVATFAESLQQALLIGFFVLFPLMFLSGTTVPVESMPVVMQTLAWGSPTRYYMEIALGTLLKGVGWRELWQPLAGLALLAALLAALAWLRLARADTLGARTAGR